MSDAACLNPTAFLSFVVGNGAGNVTSTVNTWLSGLCSSGACTNQSIANVVTNLTSGCSNELSALGVSVSSIQSEVISIAQQVYPTVRQVACLKDDSTSQLCAIETLSNLQSVIGDITDLSVLNLFADAEKLFANGVQSIACTDCMKASMMYLTRRSIPLICMQESFSIAKSNFPSLVTHAEPEAQALCGASFLDGNLPSTVSQSANDAVFSAASSTSANTGFKAAYTALAPSITVLGSIFAAFALLG
ncbi:hypothetical protein D9757_000695 [Collybiopsis confluens]|uniref:Uncharacterized protein n=1 Tax=Collybiopsis confluens TaxID=2823264 RepID=A0A8H5I1N8_9AGAR|nr:hypothetical protein D9757_000695 [Collybiopsis confluens]